MFTMLESTTTAAFLRGKNVYLHKTGRFPYVLSRGGQYLFTLYDYDYNAILFNSLKTWKDTEIATVFISCYLRFLRHEHEVQLNILDNECSKHLKDTFKKAKIMYELVPPHVHRRNTVEDNSYNE